MLPMAHRNSDLASAMTTQKSRTTLTDSPKDVLSLVLEPRDEGQQPTRQPQDVAATVANLMAVSRSQGAEEGMRIAAVSRLAGMCEEAHEQEVHADCVPGAAHGHLRGMPASSPNNSRPCAASWKCGRCAIDTFVECGVVDTFRDLCSAAQVLALRLEAATALGNVAALSDAAAEVLASRGSIEALTTLLVSVDVDVGTVEGEKAVYAALNALANQFGTQGALRALTARRCLTRLVALSACSVTRVAETSGWLLCLLATGSATSRDALAYNGLLPAIISYGACGAPQAQEEAAWALAALLAESSPADALAGLDSCYDLLLDLLQSESLAVRLQASWALANLALHPVGQCRLSELPCIPPLFDAIRAQVRTPPLPLSSSPLPRPRPPSSTFHLVD